MAKNNQRGRNNNNSSGRNQYSDGWVDTAKERPFTTAAAAAAAVGAGVFLWSRRNQISEQISSLSDQVTDWASNMQSNSDGEMAMADGGRLESGRSSSSSSKNRSGSGSGSGAGSRSASSASSPTMGTNGTDIGSRPA